MKLSTLSPLIVLTMALVGPWIQGCEGESSVAPPVGGEQGEPKPDPIITADSLHTSKYSQGLVYYAQVDKAGDYFRRMFIDSTSAKVVSRTGALPENTLLLMETWFGTNQSTIFIRKKVNGQWLSDSFSPSLPNYNNIVLTASCNSCHSRARLSDDTFTLTLIRKALQRNSVQTITCDQPSFTPCDLSVYEGN